jgi:alpha-tubulin suppressor-like RCC1 family protein
VRIISVAVSVSEARAVYSFGLSDGRLGHGKGGRESVFFPKRIEALAGVSMTSVAAVDSHGFALTRCGRVFSWGAAANDNPELGRWFDSDDGADSDDKGAFNPLIPHVITALLGERVRAIAAGLDATCAAVTEGGALYTWGQENYGILGHGGEYNWYNLELVTALQGIRVVRVSLFCTHALALAADGSVYSFGEGAGLGAGHPPGR